MSTPNAETADGQPIGHRMDATSQEVYDAGMAVRREVLGAAHVDRAESKKDSTTEDFQNLITRYAWGTVWTRPGLDRRMRSAVTVVSVSRRRTWCGPSRTARVFRISAPAFSRLRV